ncbi:MAG: ATPase component of transporter with duplicated ATPase domain [Clostridiales bacterium]|jgi:ATP-binding cassette subfamily F protein 3|nr:ATPase component of transporter with duplicated ATPase domain [Clostridiales bacterium]
MIALQAQNNTKSYGADIIFEDISLIINAKEKVGLVGPNGIGKSTFLKCLAGEEPLDEGQIIVGKDIRVGYLAQAGDLFSGEEKVIDLMLSEYEDLLSLRSEITKLETMMSDPAIYAQEHKLDEVMARYSKAAEKYERQDGYSFESKIKGMIKGLGFEEADFNRPISTFSGGQKTRLALAKLLLREPELILLDEPTNYLDIKAVEWLEDYLATYPGAILAVSHDRYFLDRFVERILELTSQGLQSYPGNYTRYLILKEKKLQTELKEYRKHQEKIKRLEEYVNRYRAGVKSKQARGRQKQLQKMSKMEKPQILEKKAAISFNMLRDTGEIVLEMEDINKSYPGKKLFENLSLKIYKGEKVALLGDNGVGKSTLLKIIAGQIQAAGKIRYGSRVKIAYYDQEHENLSEENTVLDEIYTGPHITEHEARSVLGRFLFAGETVQKKVKNLSGGERSRLVLAKLFLQEANFLIMDEPTNHLDVNTREMLEDALSEFPGTMLFVSHDRYFINRLATRVLELENEQLTEYVGDYDYYRWKKQDLLGEQLLREKQRKIKQKQVQLQQKVKNKKDSVFSLEDLEKRIEELEERANELIAMLGDSSTYNNSGQEIRNLTEQYDDVNSELQRLYGMWEKKIEENES